jgi:hypothetical protein
MTNVLLHNNKYNDLIGHVYQMRNHQVTVSVIYLKVFCILPRQSTAITFRLRDLKNSVTSLRRLVLGAKHPVINQASSQPLSSLALYIYKAHAL